MAPEKHPAVDKLKAGREAMAVRCQEVAEALVKEARVETVVYHDKGLEGSAWAIERKITVPRPTTRRRLYIVAHECAHVALGHTSRRSAGQTNLQEFLCEQWAHDALRRHGIAVPKKSTEQAKEYVAWKIHQAIRRGAKSIDTEALQWCQAYHSREVKAWLKNARPQQQPAKPTSRSTKKPPKAQKGHDVASLITQGASVAKLVEPSDRDSLTGWFNAYLSVEVEPGSHTFRAKTQDIARFLQFFYDTTHTFDCDQWTPSITKSFVKWLTRQKSGRTGRKLAPSTCGRVADTLKHAARWIHRHRPFLAGNPFDRVGGVVLDDPEWKGLKPIEVTRLRSAAEQLVRLRTRPDQAPLRDQAAFLVLIHTGLRVDELCGLDLEQYHRNCLWDIRRKGNRFTKKIFLDKPVREALDWYLKDERQSGTGPLFRSKTGRRLAQQNIYDALDRLARQANSTLPVDEQIQIHPHLLRHTALRRITRTKGIAEAWAISGLNSCKYLLRYVQADEEEIEEATTGLWD